MNGYTRMATLLKALAHPARLRILAVLQQDEACVCHLEAVLGMRQAYISQHLMRLRDAGLVVDRRERMNVFYALSDQAVPRLLDAIQENAAILAHAQSEHLLFPRPQEMASACTCPKCQAKVAAGNLAEVS